MKSEGILKGADRKETNWKKTKFGEPFKEALDRFREDVLGRYNVHKNAPEILLKYELLNLSKQEDISLNEKGKILIPFLLLFDHHTFKKNQVQK